MRKTNYQKSARGKTAKGIIQAYSRELIKDIVTHSMKIAEIKRYHKKSQNIFENRLIKKEENYIMSDSNFSGQIYPKNNSGLKWVFISKSLGKIITVEDNGEIKLYEFNTKSSNVYNILNKEEFNLIISAELFEHAQTADCKLLILLKDLTFFSIDLIILNSQTNNEEEYDINKIINSATSKTFDFKPYLNLPNNDLEIQWEKDYKNIILFPKSINDNSKDIILNFSHIAGKFLVFNFYSNSIVGNYIINHKDFEEENDNNLTDIYEFIKLFINKSWSIYQYECTSKIIETICSKQDTRNFIKLAKILMMDDGNEESLEKLISDDFPVAEDEIKNIYSKKIFPFIKFKLGNISIYTILRRIKYFLDKVYEGFLAFKKDDYSLIKCKNRLLLILFMKCFSRKIKLKECFKFYDQKNKGYVDEQLAREILNDLTIGFSNSELDDIFKILNLFDENNKYMYNYLFDTEEYLIAKILYMSNIDKNNNIFSCNCINIEDCDFDIIEKDEALNFIINSIFNKRKLTNILYLKTTNLIFTITSLNKNIYIFKRETKLTNNPEILLKIGTINLNSFYNEPPQFIDFIEERNLLITQKTKEKSTELVLINIYEDLIFPNKDKKYIKYEITKNSKNASKNLITFQDKNPLLFEKFLYLQRNEIFLLYGHNTIYLINPKIPKYNLSLKMSGSKNSRYTDICKNYCENPDEEMGKSSLNIFWKTTLQTRLKQILTFSFVNKIFGSEHNKNYSSTDWIVFLNDKNEINSYSVNQIFLSLSSKMADVPLPGEEEEQILSFINKKMKHSLINYHENEVNNFYSYNSMLKKKDNEIINQIAFNIKESLINGNMLMINPKYFQIQNIHQLVFLLKYLKLNYSTFQLFEMYPELNFSPVIYEQNSEFLKYGFSLKKKNYDETNENEDIRIPKSKNLFKSDLSELEPKYTIFDSGLKKLGMFILKQRLKEKDVFEKIDKKKEEILDSNQFNRGCQDIGLLSPNYLNPEELKELFKHMDINNNNVVTLDEFLNFLKKSDIKNILLNIKNENNIKIKNEYINALESEKFFMSSSDIKIQSISKKIEDIKNYYSRIKEVNEEEVLKTLQNIFKVISIKDFTNKFKLGIIFPDEFKNFLSEHNMEISEEDIINIFGYFDKKNKNNFILLRDILIYHPDYNDNLSDKENFSSMDNNNLESQYQNLTDKENLDTKNSNKKSKISDNNKKINFASKLNSDKYLLIWMGIMKKLIKFCLMILNIEPKEFSDKFIFVKESKHSFVNLNFIQTKLIIEKLTQKITNFLPIEKKILFEYYLDYYKYGILFKENLKSLFDDIMDYIYEQFSAIDDFNFRTFDSVNGNKYISEQNKNLELNNERLRDKNIKELLPIFDISFLEFIYHLQKKNNFQNLDTFNEYLYSITKGKDYLSEKEFNMLLKDISPIEIYNSKFVANLFDYLSESIILLNEPKKKVVTIPRLIMSIIYMLKQKEAMKKIVNCEQIYYAKENLNILLENFDSSITKLKQYDDIGNQIYNLSSQYHSLIKEAIFSGVIILSKKKEIDIIKHQLISIQKSILNYNNYFLLQGNSLLVKKFNRRLKAINKLNKELSEMGVEDSQYSDGIGKKDLDYSKIQIPTVIINEENPKKFANIKKYLCGMIESFDYYHPELNCPVNVIKIRKTFLFEEISEVDGQNLLKHIEFSLKVNHYLQQEYLNKSTTIKSFEDFPFLRNLGVFSKEIIINQRIEEEYYIINEKINPTKYISLYSLIKSNGGLLQIPELINTDMAFYILRYWGKNILNILSDLFKINVSLKYFTVRDFFVSYDGKKLKMANLLTYSFCDMKGNIYSGPDLLKILILLEDIQSSQLDTEEQKTEIYSNAYIPPETIKSNKNLTSRVDSWVFGIILFNILFGHSPISYYTQIKEWWEYYYNQKFTKDVYDIQFMNSKNHFYYNPFSNISEIMEDKDYFLKALKLKSFSAVVKKTHLNLATENNNTINGIGIIFDMINSCLSIDPRKRPYLSSLIQCDLFSFEPQELVLCNKFLINVLNYYSPDMVIHKKILIPLRGICVEVIKNENSNPNEINNYQNFIFNVIRELNIYLFSKTFSAKARHSDIKIDKDNNDIEDDIYIKTPQCYFKNSIIVKYVIEMKIIDILIFLVLRHFDTNLTYFKKKFNKELKKEMMDNVNNLGKAKTINLTTEKKSNYNNEMRHYCGRLISALIDFLYNCIQAMASYDHALTLYVENVLIWIIKLFIGEENQLLGEICDYKNSEDKLKKYLIYRTFMRNENSMLKKEFKEDELDQIFSILNANKNLCEVKSYWCPELYYFTIDLFKEAFGEKCLGNSNYIVIKNYFLTINSYTRNIANLLENPLVNNKINSYLSFIGRDQQIQINYSFINTDYTYQILSLTDMCTNLFLKNSDENSYLKNLEDKKNGLSFIHTILQNKNRYKIRGCLDFKIHFIIQKFLFTNQNNLSIKKEIFNILKEISLCLVDMNEINWLFGNNFDKVFGELYKEKTDLIDLTETYGYGNTSNWDSNFSLIDFMNKLLIQPHSFVLYFTNRFLSINYKKSADSYINYMKEFGNIFINPLCLTPIIKAIKNPAENYVTKQLALDIIFNLMLSNDKRIISNFNLTLCNFYELLVNTVRNCIQLPKHLQAKNDDIKSVEMNADKLFKDSVRSVIKIIIEQQNPYIRTQIFSSPTMLKYMKQNNLVFKARMNINEIENKFNEINKNYLNKTGKNVAQNQEKIDGKIIFWINCFKCWIFHIGNENIQSYMPNIKNVMYIIYKILNNEWSLGIKNNEKNCLVFNIIKLYEWIIKNYHHEFIFPKDDESLTFQMIINFMNKIRDNNLTMKDIIIKINKMNVAKTDKDYFNKSRKIKSKEISKEKEDPFVLNLFGNKSYTLQKLYNYISIKLLNIIYIIFSQNDHFYNKIFEKIKFGVILSELFKVQYDTISLFLDQENIDISILDNYMAEVKIRLGLFETMMKLPKQYDDIKLQFLQTDFINYMFKNMINDFRKFKTDYKKLTLEFLAFKTSYVLRTEAFSFLNIIFKKNNNINIRTKIDCFVYDEVIRNIKVTNFIANELYLIKKRVKGNEVLSSLSFFNTIIINNEREIIRNMNLLNASEYFIYAMKKDNTIKKLYPFIPEYINKVQKGIEYEK